MVRYNCTNTATLFRINSALRKFDARMRSTKINLFILHLSSFFCYTLISNVHQSLIDVVGGATGLFRPDLMLGNDAAGFVIKYSSAILNYKIWR